MHILHYFLLCFQRQLRAFKSAIQIIVFMFCLILYGRKQRVILIFKHFVVKLLNAMKNDVVFHRCQSVARASLIVSVINFSLNRCQRLDHFHPKLPVNIFYYSCHQHALIHLACFIKQNAQRVKTVRNISNM